jgi:hypothetical protein
VPLPLRDDAHAGGYLPGRIDCYSRVVKVRKREACQLPRRLASQSRCLNVGAHPDAEITPSLPEIGLIAPQLLIARAFQRLIERLLLTTAVIELTRASLIREGRRRNHVVASKLSRIYVEILSNLFEERVACNLS